MKILRKEKSLNSKNVIAKMFVFGFIGLFIIGIFIACSNNENTPKEVKIESKLRESFLENKDFATMKADFNELSDREKIALWDEKLNQLLNQNIPAKHKSLIIELKIELAKEIIDVKAISDISINLANITPEDDFYKMFATLDNYKYNEHFVGRTKVSEEFRQSLVSIRFNYKKNAENIGINSKSNGGRPCNCNWTCSLYAGGPSSNCKPTTSGCGFLWAFECEKRVGPVLQVEPNEPSPIPIDGRLK
jgi:hypothetical protein